MTYADYLLKLASMVSSEEARELDQDIMADLRVGDASDSQDLKILLSRIIKNLSTRDFESFISNMKKLDLFIRYFKHESIDPDLYDLISDQDLWNWLYLLETEKLSADDLFMMTIIKEEMLSLLGKDQLFI